VAKKTMSKKQRAAVSERMRQYWAGRRRAKKKAAQVRQPAGDAVGANESDRQKRLRRIAEAAEQLANLESDIAAIRREFPFL
jgi:hypothetical protein